MRLSHVSGVSLALFSFILISLIHAFGDGMLFGSALSSTSQKKQVVAQTLLPPSLRSNKKNIKKKKNEEHEEVEEEEQEETEEVTEDDGEELVLPEKPTGLRYYGAATWYVLKNVIFVDFLWAYILPAYGVSAASHYFAKAPWSDFFDFDFLLDVAIYKLAPAFVFNTVRFLLGEFLALFLTSLGYVGTFFLYKNGSALQTTRFLGVDLVTLTWATIVEFSHDGELADVYDENFSKFLVKLSDDYTWLKPVGKSIFRFASKACLVFYPFYNKDYHGTVESLCYISLLLLVVNILISKYLTIPGSIGGLGYIIHWLYKKGLLNISSAFTALSALLSFTPSQLAVYTVIGFLWYITVTASNGSPVRKYPLEYYPSQNSGISIGGYILSIIMYMVHDIGIGIVAFYFAFMFAFKKFEGYLKGTVFTGVSAYFDKTYPTIQEMWKNHLPALIVFKVSLTMGQKFAAFVLNRHFPFCLDSSGIFSINWRYFGLVDVILVSYFVALVWQAYNLRVQTEDLKTYKSPKALKSLLKRLQYDSSLPALDPADEFQSIARLACMSLNEADAFVRDTSVVSAQEYFIKTSTFYTGLFLILFSGMHFILSLFPKLFAALFPPAWLGYLRYTSGSFPPLKPTIGDKYRSILIYNFVSTSVPLLLNYEIKADSQSKVEEKGDQVEKVEREKVEGEESGEEQEMNEDKESLKGNTEEKDSEESTEKSTEVSDKGEEEAKEEAKEDVAETVPTSKEDLPLASSAPSPTSEPPLIDENNQETPSMNRSPGKDLKNSASRKKKKDTGKSKRSSKKSDAVVQSTFVALAVSLLFTL